MIRLLKQLAARDQAAFAEGAGERESRRPAQQRPVEIEEGGRGQARATLDSADERQRLDDAAALAAERLDLLRDRHDRPGRFRLRLRGHDRRARITLLSQRGIERHRAEQRHPELLGELRTAAAPEDVTRHVLDDAQQSHVRLLRHRGRARSDVLREPLWRRHDDDLGPREELTE